jgi:hypothetical protein
MALLYFSTGGENWADSSGFLSAMPVCSWNESSYFGEFISGVRCDPLVVELRFQNNLRGQLPTELGLLTSLEYLHLCKFATVSSSQLDRSNNIVGIGLTIYLLYGSVGSNQLTGPIPTELGLLTSLQSLDLCKFATVSSSELDTIILLGSVLQVISSTVL